MYLFDVWKPRKINYVYIFISRPHDPIDKHRNSYIDSPSESLDLATSYFEMSNSSYVIFSTVIPTGVIKKIVQVPGLLIRCVEFQFGMKRGRRSSLPISIHYNHPLTH